jgi:hypothetical protein
MSRKDDIRKLIIRSRRRLQKLKEQQAGFGMATPTHILIEIEDVEAEITRLEAELKAEVEETIGQPSDNSIVASMRTSQLAGEVRGLLEAMGFEIQKLAYEKNKHVEFLTVGTVAGEDIKRWYICSETRITPADIEKLQWQISNTPESKGWIVTSYSIDNKTQKLLKMANIRAYTVAEFYRQMLQYDHYLKEFIDESLTKEVEKYWVDLECKADKESFNLVQHVDQWLDSQGADQLMLSGDFGTGKSWFCRYYTARLARHHLDKPDQYRIPVLISLRGYTKALKIEQLITDTLVNTYHLKSLSFEIFNHLNSHGRLLLIFDGFDEMEQRVDYDVAMRNYEEILRTVAKASKVILTSRPYFISYLG